MGATDVTFMEKVVSGASAAAVVGAFIFLVGGLIGGWTRLVEIVYKYVTIIAGWF